MTFAWIEERKTEWPVAILCRVREVSRSKFYAWRSRVPGVAAARREGLTERVTEIHAEVKARYGSPRMHAVELLADPQAGRVGVGPRLGEQQRRARGPRHLDGRRQGRAEPG